MRNLGCIEGMAGQAAIGIYGLGVMGRNLALNLAEKGVAVAAFDPWPQARAAMAGAAPRQSPLKLAENVSVFVSELAGPGIILLMVKAGEPVDAAIAQLQSMLGAGGILADGGNSHFRDSERRSAALARHGIGFLGVGISGGEEGARHGAAMMAGGAEHAYERVEPLLRQIAATADGSPCLARLGPAGAGHFAKMVHNSLEYAEMQLIAEAVFALRAAGLEWDAIADDVAEWNRGPGACYLLEITAALLRRKDVDTGAPLIDVVLDSAEQKGTGQWGAAVALDLGAVTPTLVEAVMARSLSSLREIRVAAAGPLEETPSAVALSALSPKAVGNALLAARLAVYDQGFGMLAAASKARGFGYDLARLAEIWRAGCIIRGALLNPIAAAWREQPTLPRLLLAPWFRDALRARVADWRRVAAAAIASGIAAPALLSALAYYDGMRTARSGASLIQLQRDTFGAHGFERIDRPGTFHLDPDA